MRSRPAPTVGDRRPSDALANDPQLIAWTRRLKADRDAVPHNLSESELFFLVDQIMGRRGMGLRENHYAKALRETCPVLASPQVTDFIGDLRKAFSLPEMQTWWAAWRRPRSAMGARGPEAGDTARKMLMCSLAMTGVTPHANTAHQLLRDTPGLRAVFEELDSRCRGLDVPDPIEPMTYQAANHKDKKLWIAAGSLAPTKRTTLALIKSLEAIHGDRIGKGWLIDGCATPAWAPQRGSGDDPEKELALRKFSPEAGFRAYGYSRAGGKESLDAMSEGEVLSQAMGGTSKAWRGFYTVPLVEQATGLGVPVLVDSKSNESKALIPALSELLKYSPDLAGRMKWLAGDSAWDDNPSAKLVEVGYGVHGIFRLHNRQGLQEIERGQSPDDRLLGFTHEGEVHCTRHSRPVEFERFERPNRAGLGPGQAGSEARVSGFRWRGICKHDRDADGNPRPPCGRVSLPATSDAYDWRRLGHFPHHKEGRPDLHAFREVVLTARMGQVESFFQAIKAGHLLLGAGAGRQRVRDRMYYEALVSLACLFRAALTVYDQRVRAGLMPADGESYVGRDRTLVLPDGFEEPTDVTELDDEEFGTTLAGDPGGDPDKESGGDDLSLAAVEFEDDPADAGEGADRTAAHEAPTDEESGDDHHDVVEDHELVDDEEPTPRSGKPRAGSQRRRARRGELVTPPSVVRKKGHLSLIVGGRS